jgi:ATP-dependent DNA helicase RecQ
MQILRRTGLSQCLSVPTPRLESTQHGQSNHEGAAPLWLLSLDAEATARALGQPRARIIAALNYLEEQGDLIVEAAGVRAGFRRLHQPNKRKALVKTLADRFLQRETHDIERVHSVVALAEHPGCLTQHLLEYFGEERDDCGHCSRCDGERARPLSPTSDQSRQLDNQAIRKLRAERLDALSSPRQLARYLCGITSPASTRAKLRNRPEFGQWSSFRFADVLALTNRS